MSDVPQPALPRLDLAAYHVRSFSVFWTYDWRDQFGPLFEGVDAGQPFISGTHYQVGDHVYLTSLSLERLDAEDRRTVTVGVFYDGSPPVAGFTIPEAQRREGEFLRAAEVFTGDLQLSCGMIFDYPDVPPDQLWFPLPTQVGQPPAGGGGFELRGVRGIKLGAGEPTMPEYGFFLDRPEFGGVYLGLSFPLLQAFSLTLPEAVLKRGIAVAADLVSPQDPKGP